MHNHYTNFHLNARPCIPKVENRLKICFIRFEPILGKWLWWWLRGPQLDSLGSYLIYLNNPISKNTLYPNLYPKKTKTTDAHTIARAHLYEYTTCNELQSGIAKMKAINDALMPDLGSLFTDPQPLPNYLQIPEEDFSVLSREEQFWILQSIKLKYESLNIAYQAHCGRNTPVKGGAPAKWTEEELGFFSDWLSKIRATSREKTKKLSEMAALRILVREMLQIPKVEESMKNGGFWLKPGCERNKQVEGMATTIKQAFYRQKKSRTYHPIRIMFYYPNRTQAQRIQKTLETLYAGVGGHYYYGDAAWSFILKYTGVDLLALMNQIALEKTNGQ